MKSDQNKTIPNKSDLRSFGFIMGGMFAIIFGLIFPWLSSKIIDNWPVWPFIVLISFFIVAFIRPQVLLPIYFIWVKIGDVLGFINNRIILGLIFFLLIFPIGLILKMIGKDSMNRKLLKNTDTYRKVVSPRDKNHLEKPF